MDRMIRGYRLVRRLGQGGTGIVYLAEHMASRRRVALKVLSPVYCSDTVAVQRFRQEFRILRGLVHRNIVQVYEFGQWREGFYISAEYIPGVTLERLLQTRRRVGLDETVAIVGQMAAALDAAHQRGIIHRDLKPSNVLLELGGRVVLTDFGIARPMNERSNLTLTGEIVGTYGYMAPEHALGHVSIDHKVDIYALGVLTYRMLAGQLPFCADHPLAVLYAHVHTPPPPIRAQAGGSRIPAEVGEVVLQALKKPAEERPSSAGAYAQQLSRAVGLRVHRRALRADRPVHSSVSVPAPAIWMICGVLLLVMVAVALGQERQKSAQSSSAPPWTLAYVCGRRGEQLCVLDHAGTRTAYTFGNQVWTPTWSPDGRRLAFASSVGDDAAIWVLDIETGKAAPAVNQRGIDAWSPSWSPNGLDLAFDQQARGVYNVYAQRVGSLAQRQLTHGRGIDSDPAWSPSGDHLVFVSDRHGDLNIYTLDLVRGVTRRLTDRPERDFAPVWSPDGDLIAYECEDTAQGDVEICTMRPDGSERRMLTSNDVDDRQPAWSPDSQFIAFSRPRPGSDLWDVWVVRRDGRDERVLIRESSSATHPVWKP